MSFSQKVGKTVFPSRFYSNTSTKYDIIVIGGGIVGTAIAKILKETTNQTKIALIEKENDLAQHQSSHNSQVIHAGIYYEPDSLKATLCSKGAKMIYEYCEKKNINIKRAGKLILAKNSLEKIRLKELFKRGQKNEVAGLELISDWTKINEIQPNCSGLVALWSPNSGNINWKTVTENFGNDFENNGGNVFRNCKVTLIQESPDPIHPILIHTNNKIFLTKFVILCIGLNSGSLLENPDQENYKNISMNVTYYFLNKHMQRFVKTNIYAMPHLDLPFLGIHLSPTVDNEVLLGPTAVPAFGLENYESWKFDNDYVRNNLLTKNMSLLFLKNFSTCLKQVSENMFCNVRKSSLEHYFPMLCAEDIGIGYSGVQGQLIRDDGEMIDDFIIEMFEGKGIKKRIINCRFIPSPGATSSLAIADMISKEFKKVF